MLGNKTKQQKKKKKKKEKNRNKNEQDSQNKKVLPLAVSVECLSAESALSLPGSLLCNYAIITRFGY